MFGLTLVGEIYKLIVRKNSFLKWFVKMICYYRLVIPLLLTTWNNEYWIKMVIILTHYITIFKLN